MSRIRPTAVQIHALDERLYLAVCFGWFVFVSLSSVPDADCAVGGGHFEDVGVRDVDLAVPYDNLSSRVESSV